MKIIADLHTHTNIHEHAHSTLEENCIAAKKIGLEAIATTNHGPALEDGASHWHFGSLAKSNPGKIHGVYHLSGIEVNILEDGGIDMEDDILDKLDLVIASFHQEIFYPKDKNHVNDMLNEVLLNKRVNVFGHLGNEIFRFDYEDIISKCNRYNKIVEVNNHSFEQRPGSDVNCLEIIKLCKKYEVPLVVNTDAHISCNVGHFEEALKVIEKADFPEELVVNSSMDRLKEYIKSIDGFDFTKRNRYGD